MFYKKKVFTGVFCVKRKCIKRIILLDFNIIFQVENLAKYPSNIQDIWILEYW